jgi:hypothetical protein
VNGSANRSVLVPAALALAATGCMIALAFWGYTARDAVAQQSWQRAEAHVLSSELREGARDRVSHNCSTTDGRGPRQVYVTYRYAVGDRTHTSRAYDSRHEGELFCADPPARERLAAVAPGASLTVCYDPENPQRAVIARQNANEAYAVLALLAIAALVLWGSFARQLLRYRRSG